MPSVVVKEDESFESALRRFKKQCEKAGVLSELRKREHYEKPSVRRKKKMLAARKKAMKRMRGAYAMIESHAFLVSGTWCSPLSSRRGRHERT